MLRLTLDGKPATTKQFAKAMEGVREETFSVVESGLKDGGLDEATDEIRKLVHQVGLFNPWLMFIAGIGLGRLHAAKLEEYGESSDTEE